MTPQIDWYAARAAGVVAYLLLAAIVVVGLTLAGRAQLPRWPKFAVTEVHRFGSLLVGVFLGLHVLTIGLDTYTRFSPTQLVVPFVSGYRPLWVGIGIVAAEFLVALAVTNALRTRIQYRTWRRAHYLAFLVWAGATVHAVGAGTDSGSLWLTAIYLVAVGSVAGALVWRILRRRLAPTPLRQVVALGTMLGASAVIVLSAVSHTVNTKRVVILAAPTSLNVPFTGSISQLQGSSGLLVSILGRATGTHDIAVRIDLATPDGSTLLGTAIQLRDGRTGPICAGTVEAIGAKGFTGTCTFPPAARRTVTGSWTIANDRQITGTISMRS